MSRAGEFRVDVHLGADQLTAALRRDAVRGLTSVPKQLEPVWFYDKRGSDLFEDITRLPEYYPTRREREILDRESHTIASLSRPETLVELGSGSSRKTRLLLDACAAQGTLRRFVPLDVSESALREAGSAISADYPTLDVHALVADFNRDLAHIPGGGRRLVAFLGGTIGNLTPDRRREFLADLARTLDPGDSLLLGADLVKDPTRLIRAYDDAAGVTAEFNRNVLHVLNRELGADFAVTAFEHVAIWDAEQAWIEMRLRATAAQVVTVAQPALTVLFEEGEEMRTEISAKFLHEALDAELAAAGFEPVGWWTDMAGDFAVSLAVVT